MNDTISRQEAIDAFEKELSAKYNRRELAIGFVGVESILKNLPSAQRKGKWVFVEYPDGYFHTACSECGQWADEDVYLKGKWRFCPNCGAEMRQDDPSHPFADSVMMKGEEDE